MRLVAVIIEDCELDRIHGHQGWSLDFPKTKASKSPPVGGLDEDGASQAEDRGEEWEARRDGPEVEPA